MTDLRTARSYGRLVLLVVVVGVVVVWTAQRHDDISPTPPRALVTEPAPGGAAAPGTTLTPEQRQSEARSLLDPTHTGKVSPAEVDCVAASVVDDPLREQVASRMARVQNKDLQQMVMGAYLQCAYDFVLDQYMVYAPQDLTAQQKTCVRGTYKALDVQRFAEVIVLDPDAGQTGPLVLKACRGQGDGSDPFAVVAPTQPPSSVSGGASIPR